MQKAAAAVALLLVATALVATAVGSGFYFTEDDLKSEDALWDLYGRWAAHHGVVRQPGRFAAFKANAEDRHAKQRRRGGHLMALNMFGDSSLEATPCLLELEATPELETKAIDFEIYARSQASRYPHPKQGGLEG